MRETPRPVSGMEGPAPGVTPEDWQARKAVLEEALANLQRLRRQVLGPRGGDDEERGLPLAAPPGRPDDRCS